MTIQEIYKALDSIGCLTFATIGEDYPETRIAHFIAQDEEGIYFTTMSTKPFYKQLKATGKVSACGMCASTQVGVKDDENLVFDAGYTIRISGDVREVSMEEIKRKNSPKFDFCIADHKRYPATVVFVLYRAKGEIYDYDYECISRDHKLERVRFTYGGLSVEAPGLRITEGCIGCRTCVGVCSFKAIYPSDDKYKINGERCDECGNCVKACPINAIKHKGR